MPAPGRGRSRGRRAPAPKERPESRVLTLDHARIQCVMRANAVAAAVVPVYSPDERARTILQLLHAAAAYPRVRYGGRRSMLSTCPTATVYASTQPQRVEAGRSVLVVVDQVLRWSKVCA